MSRTEIQLLCATENNFQAEAWQMVKGRIIHHSRIPTGSMLTAKVHVFSDIVLCTFSRCSGDSVMCFKKLRITCRNSDEKWQLRCEGRRLRVGRLTLCAPVSRRYISASTYCTSYKTPCLKTGHAPESPPDQTTFASTFNDTTNRESWDVQNKSNAS